MFSINFAISSLACFGQAKATISCVTNMLCIKFQLQTSSDLRPQKIMGIRRVAAIHVEQCSPCGFDRQSKPKNFCALRQTLCISYLVKVHSFISKDKREHWRKHKLRRSYSFSSQSRHTHRNKQAHTHIWGFPLRAVRIFICCFSSSRQVRNVNREGGGGEEWQRNGIGDVDEQAEGRPKAAFVAGAAKYATLAARHHPTHIFLCNLGSLFIFIIHLWVWYFHKSSHTNFIPALICPPAGGQLYGHIQLKFLQQLITKLKQA